MNLKNKRKLVLIFLVTLALFTVLYLSDLFFNTWDLKFQFPVILRTPIKMERRKTELLSPLVETVEAKTKKIVSPTPFPRPNNPIKAEIYDVFGKEHYKKAMMLLECENKSLNPEAVNVNKGGSIDYGLFQINSYWHGFNKFVNNERYLFDPAINIRIAWRIYEGNGYSFKMWTCGEKLNI